VWAEAAQWQLSDTPSLTIGVVGGDPAYELYSVGNATRLGDGRIVIVNGGTRQLRFYDGTGVHLQDVGGRGEGPGEFSFLRELHKMRDDSIMTYDSSLGRGSIFDSSGRLVRSFRLTQVEHWRQLWARRVFDDGTLLVTSQAGGEFPPRAGLFDQGRRIFSRFSAEGVFLNNIGEGSMAPAWGFESGSGFGVAYTSVPLVLLVPPIASDGTSLYLGTGKDFQVGRRSLDGSLARIIRWAAEPRPISQEVISRYRSDYVEGRTDPNDRRRAESLMQEMPFPEILPTYQGLLVDALDYLWVEQFRAPWEEQPVWWVFDPTGKWLGELRLPMGFRILEVGSDYILGHRRDENGVEYVSLYALTRS